MLCTSLLAKTFQFLKNEKYQRIFEQVKPFMHGSVSKIVEEYHEQVSDNTVCLEGLLPFAWPNEISVYRTALAIPGQLIIFVCFFALEWHVIDTKFIVLICQRALKSSESLTVFKGHLKFENQLLIDRVMLKVVWALLKNPIYSKIIVWVNHEQHRQDHTLPSPSLHSRKKQVFGFSVVFSRRTLK